MRDYILLGSDHQAQESLRTEFQSIHDETAAALQACIQTLPSGKREPFQHLAGELENYWSTIGPTFASGAKADKTLEKSVLRGDILSRHAEILALTKEVSTVNDEDLKDAERRIAEAAAQFRRRLLRVAVIAFGCGLVLAAVTIIYAGQLENSVKEKYYESLQAQRELKELSKRLVDTEERERRAISRELHDEVGQSLSALLMDVENLAEMSPRKMSSGKASRILRHSRKTASMKCATWPCCYDRRCSTTSVSSPRWNGRLAKCPNAPGCSSIPWMKTCRTTCPKTIRPASTESSRKP